MNAGGIVVVIAGVWLGCQIFGGKMLERLNIVATSGDGASTGTTKPGAYVTPKAGPSSTVTNA